MDDHKDPNKSISLVSKIDELVNLSDRHSSDQQDTDTIQSLRIFQAALLGQIGEMRRTQKALEQSRDQYLDLYEFAPVGYLTLNSRLVVLHINSTGVRLLQTERSQVLGQCFNRLVAPQDRSRYQREVKGIRGDGDRRSLDVALLRGDRSIFYAQLDFMHVPTYHHEATIRIALVDITERRQAEADIRKLAFYDPLTALPNRRFLLDRLSLLLATIDSSTKHAAVLFIDLDDFKTLNDTHGHSIGDELLQQVAHRLTRAVRPKDTVGRLGGDEFVVILEDLDKDEDRATAESALLGERIRVALTKPYVVQGRELLSTASVGASLFRDGDSSAEDRLKQADLALYSAKTAGRNMMRTYDPAMQEAITARALLDTDLRLSLQEGRFLLHYQPQVDRDRKLIGVEALIRWQHPTRGLLLPSDFVPFAEEKGLILPLGQWVLRTACEQMAAWQNRSDLANLTVAINVSAREFRQIGFIGGLLDILKETGANPKNLILEFTESLMFGTIEDTMLKMKILKARGVRFSLDDFGVGYSSLVYLQSLPLDQLKIDQTFVRNMVTNSNDAAIARSVVALGQSLGLEIIAEGVEDEDQHALLASYGCNGYQGFLFGRPGPVEDLIPIVHNPS